MNGYLGIDFEGLLFAVFFLLLFLFLNRLFKKKRALHIVFPTLPLFFKKKRLVKERLSSLPDWLLYGALTLLLLALINPHRFVEEKGHEEEQETQGLAIFLLLDNSSSMSFKVLAKSPLGAPQEMTRMELSKQVAKQFIAGDPRAGLPGRKGDMIGVVAFARVAKVLSPLTLDHAKVLEEINRLEFNRDIKQVGTGIGYALYKTISMIKATLHFGQTEAHGEKPFYEIKNPVVIIVTDGINEINPEDEKHPFRAIDVWKAAEFAKENGVKVYIINIDPTFKKTGGSNIELYNLMTKYTGGQFFVVNEAKDLLSIYREIDALEKSKVPLFAQNDKADHPLIKKSFYPYFILAALALIFLSVTLETFVFKRIP